MPTIQQLVRKGRKKVKKVSKTFSILRGNPQIKGTIVKVFNTTPKKPNSALRKTCRVRSKGVEFIAHIPGEGHKLQEHSTVGVIARPRNDLPGIKMAVVRNWYDSTPVENRKQGRSRYGAKKG
ncbi:30S ribosomal protein S12 [Anaplasmataceae bacterium AB001_6]|nr:30S ribosomal protein S12 [Anaplasmataceae bacterium AB001_6]